MGKSSSSTKRKRSKYSSQVRTKKRSKIKSCRPKKLRRHDDSVSYSSDDSRSSVSVSFSSEDSYKHRKSRSRTHNVKGSRRRVRSHSSSSEESGYLKKHQRPRRKNDSEVRKKTYRSKKKKAREASSSSRSCSTCWSSSSGSEESDNESSRGRPERREKNTRKVKNVKGGATRRRYRSRSCSSCSGHDWSKEKVTDGNVSNRLKSIITLPNEDEEGRELNRDECKEEMICDHDDYPSSRSNDSNDGGNKSVSAYEPCVESEKKRSIEIEKKEDASSFNIKTTKLPSSYKNGDDHHLGSRFASDSVGKNDALEEKTSNTSEVVGSANANDLESILREKALENLRRFRGEIQTNMKSTVSQKDENDVTLKSLSTMKGEVNEIASLEDDGTRGSKGDSAHPVQKEENIFDTENGGNDSVSAMDNAYIPNQMAVAGREKANMNLSPVINKPTLVTSALKQALSNATSTAMELPASKESDKAKLVIGSSKGKHNATSLKGNGKNGKVNDASAFASAKSSSCVPSSGVDVGLNKLQDGLQLEQKAVSSAAPLSSTARDISSSTAQDDDKEGSQLERKTMSVMRGGEMVQVSYKVYIPKKAPALARRQLKR
ncbi:uncharacterized protein LOC8264441 isoform X2 [Ricinus communis]|uniref:uncharacterized protein LOC8264441 isoform X2 n=1 Tax=Ricinus communis TaxID=3988 RepID=UPI00201AFC99|nr:uncharacterized protein LOC8264441 isoform X2 [Ricinus communis]